MEMMININLLICVILFVCLCVCFEGLRFTLVLPLLVLFARITDSSKSFCTCVKPLSAVTQGLL